MGGFRMVAVIGLILAGIGGSAPVVAVPPTSDHAFCFTDGDIPVRLLVHPVRADECPIVGRTVVGKYGIRMRVPPDGEGWALFRCGTEHSESLVVDHFGGWIRAYGRP